MQGKVCTMLISENIKKWMQLHVKFVVLESEYKSSWSTSPYMPKIL